MFTLLTFVPPFLFLPLSSVVFHHIKFLVEAVTMYSLLVTVLLLTSATNGSGGQSAVGRGGCRGGGVYQLVCVCFPSQVHKCPSQATHVHNLTQQAF